MIIVDNVRNYKKLKDECDFVFMIVRSYKNKIEGVENCECLSPSWDLLKDYLSWRNVMRKEDWWKLYKERFEKEMKNELSEKCLEYLRKGSEDKGFKIGLMCYCADVRFCHRSLIGKMLEAKGCKVIYR